MSEKVAMVDEARYLAPIWARVVKVDLRADLLEVELADALEGQHGARTIERRAPRCKSKPLVTKRVGGSFGQLMRHAYRATTLALTCIYSSCRGAILRQVKRPDHSSLIMPHLKKLCAL